MSSIHQLDAFLAAGKTAHRERVVLVETPQGRMPSRAVHLHKPAKAQNRHAHKITPFNLMALSGRDDNFDRLNLEIGLRLYGVSGAVISLDAMLHAAPRHAALAQIKRLAALCARHHAMLVIQTGRPLQQAIRITAGLAQPALGRRRNTTSTPTISIPSGGSG